MNTDKRATKLIPQDHARAISDLYKAYSDLLSWAKDTAANDLGWPEEMVIESFREDDQVFDASTALMNKLG